MTTSTIDIERLRALAEAATSGPREWVGTNLEIQDQYHNVIEPVVKCGAWCNGGTIDLQMKDSDEAFIAACDPQTITALCDEVAALRADSEKLMRVMRGYSDIISNHCMAMQAAVIAGKLESPARGLQWIANTLLGPGLLPDIAAAEAIGGAQAWFDRAVTEEEARKAAIAAQQPEEPQP